MRLARKYALAFTGASLIVIAVVAFYVFRWKTVDTFATSLDNVDTLFRDFEDYFYPSAREVAHSAKPVPGFYYSAFTALLLVPFAWLRPESAAWWWGVVQVAMTLLLCVLSSALFHRAAPRALVTSTFLCVTSLPVLHNFLWGQVSVAITLCVLGSMLSYRNDRRILAGVLLGLGASIKYYPGLLAVYFLIRRDPRAVISFLVATAAFLFLFPAAALGLTHWWSFQRESVAAVTQAAWVAEDPNSQYFGHVALRWLSKLLSVEPTQTADWLSTLGLLVACSNAWLLWRIRKVAAGDEIALSTAVLLLSLPLLLRTSWPHYFVYLPFCQMAVLTGVLPLLRCRTARAVAPLVLSVVSMACSSVFVFELFPHWSSYSESGLLLIADIVLLVALYGLVGVAGTGPVWPASAAAVAAAQESPVR